MSHNIEGLIFNKRETAEKFSSFEHAKVISLSQGFIFIPLTDELFDEIGADNNPYEVFRKFSNKIEELLINHSNHSAIMYMETDYWGGSGEQSAAIWQNGQLLMKPEKSQIGSISKGLKLMNASKNGKQDEFEAIGLTRFRSNEDWIEQPDYSSGGNNN